MHTTALTKRWLAPFGGSTVKPFFFVSLQKSAGLCMYKILRVYFEREGKNYSETVTMCPQRFFVTGGDSLKSGAIVGFRAV